jgi:hypothetical protein
MYQKELPLFAILLLELHFPTTAQRTLCEMGKTSMENTQRARRSCGWQGGVVETMIKG